MTISSPVVVLHRAQLGENIGMSARAMANCGLSTLRLATARPGWNRVKARAAAAGGAAVVDQLEQHATLPEALADRTLVFASSARRRNMAVRTVSPDEAATEICTGHHHVALLFGAESTGLDNDAISLADAVISIPVDSACASLNLSQAVLLIGHAWWRRQAATPLADQPETAPRAELAFLLNRLEKMLDQRGYFAEPAMRPVMWRNIQTMFHRGGFTRQEVQTLHGILGCLTNPGGKS